MIKIVNPFEKVFWESIMNKDRSDNHSDISHLTDEQINVTRKREPRRRLLEIISTIRNQGHICVSVVVIDCLVP
jgi:hypothetical protein